MVERRTIKTAALAEVNQGILAFARDSLSEQAHEQEWEFFCECGREDCHSYVSLGLDAYASLHDGGGAVLAPGHSLSQVERARRLLEDAEALRHQAEHQFKRARRNARDDGPGRAR